MARIRTIKPGFFKHDGLYDLEVETGLPIRVAFAGLWTCCDREGRFEWRPRRLKVEILPYDDVDMARVLDALCTRGFVEKYACNGAEYGVVRSFKRHQVINNRESASEIPPPPENADKTVSCTGGSLVEDACSTRDVHALAEGKGREGKGKESSGADAPDDASEYFSAADRVGVPRSIAGKLLQVFAGDVSEARYKLDSAADANNPKTVLTAFIAECTGTRKARASPKPSDMPEPIAALAASTGLPMRKMRNGNWTSGTGEYTPEGKYLG